MISEEKLRKVMEYEKLHGLEETAKKFNLSYETVARYKRLYKHLDPVTRAPKILVFDIETSPVKAYVWRMWDENISIEQVIEDWFVISWAAKWLNDSEYMGMVVTPKEAKKRDDKRILKGIHRLLDEADIVIAHNGVRFDIRKLNTRFLVHGLTPPSPYQVIDTLQVARKNFGFSHNRLDGLAETLGIQKKKKVEFELWKRCLDGEKDALEEMLAYNKQDVAVLEDVYYALRGWIKSHPNLNNIMGTQYACPNCGSEDIVSKGYYRTITGEFEAFKCNTCGAISRKSRTKLVSVAK